MDSGKSKFNHDDPRYARFINSLFSGSFSSTTKDYIKELVKKNGREILVLHSLVSEIRIFFVSDSEKKVRIS